MNGPSLGGERPPEDDVDEPAQKGFAAFAHRDFRLSLFSKLVSSVAVHMVMMAIAYQVYDLTGDPMNLAYIGLSVTAMAVLGAADMISVYIHQTLVQMATPDGMRGRVSAVNSVFVSTSNEIGEFRAGVVAAWIGAVPAVVLGGIGTVMIAGAFWRLFPELAHVQRMDRSL